MVYGRNCTSYLVILFLRVLSTDIQVASRQLSRSLAAGVQVGRAQAGSVQAESPVAV